MDETTIAFIVRGGAAAAAPHTSVSTVHQMVLSVEVTYEIRVPQNYVQSTKLVENSTKLVGKF
jgi:hypothetical protein